MRARFITKVIWLAALGLAAAGCRNQAQRAPVLAEAYVGPATLNVRGDIPLDSAPVATAKHGDRLEIIGRRRKFLKVRTTSGSEGWTDERQLLGASDMGDLRELAQRASKLPSQGIATSYRDLNVHTQPVPGSPSFLRLKEGEKFDVVAELVAPRTEAPRKPLIPPPEKKKPAPKKPKKEPKIPPPPLPAPPPLPSNWLELSKTDKEDFAEPPTPEAKVIPTDYWSLIRTQGGQSGWVLTRLIYMAIPDEVAQYAEGARIVSYHPIGYVQDEDKKKPIWLWTTVRGRQPFDFDSFRVFVWSLKRHRYETAYIDRSTRGYWPVLINDVSYAANQGEPAKYPGFSVCVENREGQKVRREYALLGNVVRYAGERPCELPPPVWVSKTEASPAQTVPESASAPKEGLMDRVKRWFRRSPKKVAQ